MSYDPDVMNAEMAAGFPRAHSEAVCRPARGGGINGYRPGKDRRFRREAPYNWIDSHSFWCRPPNIVVLDDQKEYCGLIRRFGESVGHAVCATLTDEPDLAGVFGQEIDLIVFDSKMPGNDGSQSLRELRQTWPDLGVIIVTDYPDSDLMLEASPCGPMMSVSRPVDNEQTLSSIRVALDGAIERKTG